MRFPCSRISRACIGVAGGLILAGGIWLALGGRLGRKEPSILLVTIDTLRADRLGAYGYGPARTPVLDRLAAEGARFDRCFASAPLTRPSHATILTGIEPRHHGVRDNLASSLPPEIPTLASRLASDFPARGAVVASDPLVAASGLARGFDSYDDALPPVREGLDVHFRERGAGQVTDSAIRFLERAGEARFLLWVHYFDPHAPYAPPQDLEGVGRSPYDGEVAYVDRELGRLVSWLEEQERLDETIVCVTADHGEGLGDHGEETHAYFLYDTTIRVPWILRYPERVRQGVEVEAVVRLADVAPTLLELAGVEPAREFDGRSVVAAIDGKEMESVPAHSETHEPWNAFGWRPLLAVRTEEWKMIEGGPRERELYRVSTDEAELVDLADSPSDECRRAIGVLGDDLRDFRLAGPERDPAGRAEGPPGFALDSIPYSWSVGPERGRGRKPPPDPMGFIRTLDREVLVAALQGRPESALLALERLCDADPGNPQLALVEARISRERGDLVRETRAFDRLRGIRPEDPRGMRGAIASRIEARNWKDATRLCKEILGEASSRDLPFVWRNLGFALLQDSAAAEAATALEHSLELDPESVAARIYLAYSYLALSRLEDAAREARTCLDAEGANPEAVHLAEAVIEEGRRSGRETQVRKYLPEEDG